MNDVQEVEMDGTAGAKLSWEETFRQMADEAEDWTDWQDLDDEDSL